LAQRRRSAHERFLATPLPTGAEEIWRYSRVEDLNLARFAPATPASSAAAQAAPAPLPPEAATLLDLVGARAGLVVTRNGAIATVELDETEHAAGVHLGAVSTVPGGEAMFGAAAGAFPDEDIDAFGALADAFAADAVALSVPRSHAVGQPIVIVHVIGGAAAAAGAAAPSGDATPPAVFPRTVVRLDENAEASVLELLVSDDDVVLVFPTIELIAGDGARLTHDVIQELGRGAWQVGRLFAAAGRDATLRSFQASLGGSFARSRTDSILTGQGGTTQLLAAFFGDEDQMHDFRTLQEHAAPRTTSDLVFKGAVAGTSRSVYSGLIRMRHGARGANAFQTNRNLVLSDGAHADSVPNLDIQENDVRCSHASAVGPVDEEQRFYLESRGVPRAAAERLILLGFFRELLERVSPAVRDFVVAAIARRVSAVVDGGES
jgi:Fe-S cluster assembly protein SufD